MRSNSVSIEPVSGPVGAEIRGIDLASDLAETDVALIRDTLFDRGVVFFRDQSITPDQHIAFAERFAPINVNRFFAHAEGHPSIAEVRKEPGQKNNIGGGWHTDHSYDIEPAMGSILLARELPPVGGDTLFASMYAAYDALSDGLKTTLEGLRAVHSSRHVFGPQAKRFADPNNDLKDRLRNADQAVQDAVHPVVIRHPGSGRRALYVNPGFTLRFDGWTAEESQALLGYLYQHAAKPEFQCRFRWQEGSIAFWDNRATWHYAVNDYHGERRLLHRITLEGTALS
jgi:taurine dioxygenase